MLCTGIVGAGMPIAVGLGLASQLKGDGKVTITNFGDGATNIGAFHESLNLASVWSLPVVFVCQNNQYGEHTRYSDTAKNASVVDRAAALRDEGHQGRRHGPGGDVPRAPRRPSTTPVAATGRCCSSASRSARSATCSATRTSTWTRTSSPSRSPTIRCPASGPGWSSEGVADEDAPGRDRRRPSAARSTRPTSRPPPIRRPTRRR